MGADQQFCLRWNNFHTNITSAFESLRDDEDFVDITLACEGKQIKAHKMVLSACSPYFRNLLKKNPCQHPIVFLKDVTFANLASILDFMYHGEVNVSHNELGTFLKTAESLKVRGLAEDDKKLDNVESAAEGNSPTPKESVDDSSPKLDELSAIDTNLSDSSPPPKKQRKRSGTSVQSAEDTSETNLSDLRETSVKNEPQDFNDENDLLGHNIDTSSLVRDIKMDSLTSEMNEVRNFGICDSVTISRNQAAMQQLQESFGTFLPSMSQNQGFLSHSSSDMQRQPFPLENVQGLSPGIPALPGPSMSQSGASQDGSQEAALGFQSYDEFSSMKLFNERFCAASSDALSSGRSHSATSLVISPSSNSNEAFTKYNSANKNLLKRRLPTGEEAQCKICGRVLCNKYVLKVHERDVHSPRKMHQCSFCGRPYSTINSLRVHISTSHTYSRETLQP